jgi:hypothetical protein
MTRLVRAAVVLLLPLGFLLNARADVTREEAASIAQRAVPGRVLAVEHGVHLDNKVVWRVRMLTNAGELRLLVIEEGTGRLR